MTSLTNIETPRGAPERITAFVNALLEAGCDMWAVGEGYSIGEPEDEPMASQVRKILADFGSREDLLEEIAACLREMGRIIITDDPPSGYLVME